MTVQEQEYIEWPMSTGISRRESALSQSAMEDRQGKALTESGSKQNSVVRVSSWNVHNAIEQGYVKPGLLLADYLRATWEGYEDDPPSPVCKCGKFIGQSKENWVKHIGLNPVGEHKKKAIKRFELVNVWGVQGAKKSTVMAQLLLLLHGFYDPKLTIARKKEICDYCQKITITNTQELIDIGRELKEVGDSYDILYLDDLNSIIPKQLSWKDREAYEAVFEALGMIRRNVRVVITSIPNIEMAINVFNRIMTFEVIVFPASKYKVERMCHDIHPHFWAKDKVTKIVIEEGSFNPYDTPWYFWSTYEARTNSQGQKQWLESMDKLEAYENGGGAEVDAEVTKRAKKMVNVPSNLLVDALREAGIKGDQNKLVQTVNVVKKKMAEQAAKSEDG